ncbi:hypothetical protein PSEUBRA_001826 [Kalmanozyma brasiliensis GHG001]|uniref:Zn(2)-C6 fungal-type domain-containing protein n=1 Tax=Kalmanozyma brasiliensis (strain GHG001) TaxID=1365824 RepID=V5EYE0_KALBG|nr:uncharacterized protein PSEUBRA_001826 [Kalmanozyma brasiliensis GHG001]EST08743.1 hypothetical protein PSEUBRA_001826 [Kalmanozyma brasiliensis GHG001]
MSEAKPPQKGSVLSNIDNPADAPSPPAIPPDQGRSHSPDEKMLPNDSKDGADLHNNSKDTEPEAKKRKRSQRACIRCRGQKLKCDGVFPCARCLKLKLVCKEPSEATSGTPNSNRAHPDDREGKPNSGSFSSSGSTRPQSQASMHLTVSGLPSHSTGPPPFGSAGSDGAFMGHVRATNHMHPNAHHRDNFSQRPPSDRFGYSLPDAVRRIDNLERTVSRLVDKVEGQSSSFDRGDRPSTSRSGVSPGKPERKRPRADSPDDSDAEVDELQDGASEASIPLQALSQQDRLSSRERPTTAIEERFAPTRASNDTIAPLSASSVVTGHSFSNGGARYGPGNNPIEAGFITIEMGQMLLEVFLTYCHVFAPFLDLEDKTSVASLSASDPFLLSVILAVGALYQESHAKGDPTIRSEIQGGLASYALSQLGTQLCSPEPTISTVQAILLIAYWPQAFPGTPDEKLLASHASDLLQSVAQSAQVAALTGDRAAAVLSSRLPTTWTALKAFESLAAIDTGKGMELTDHDLVLSKAPRPPRSSIPAPYLVRAVSVLKELQMWLGEISCNSPLPLAELPPPTVRTNLTHDWDRFKYLQSQLFDLEKRWLASETDCSRLERIVGLVDRWTLQIYLAAVALKSADLGRPSKAGNGYDARYEEESARFVAAYQHDIRQACQVLMDIFTDPEISGALLYAPGYLLRRFGQAAVASSLIVDFHDAEMTRSAQELIYLCSKRFDQLGQIDFSPFAAQLSWFVKSSYEKVGGRSTRGERDASLEASAPSSLSAIDRRRWLGGDLFTIFFGVGLALDSAHNAPHAF